MPETAVHFDQQVWNLAESAGAAAEAAAAFYVSYLNARSRELCPIANLDFH
jgi:hypothetical protein